MTESLGGPFSPFLMPRMMPDPTISSAGLRVMKLLVGTPPKTIGDLIRETGVTRTAVIEQLNELVAGGFVQRTIEPLDGRGRPRYRYAATTAALVLLFANNQQLVVPAIWKAVEEIGGKKLTQEILHSVSRQLARHYDEKITAKDSRKRLHQLRAILEDEGGMVDLATKDGQVTLTKRSCAYINMADEQRHVCRIDVEVMALIAGCPAEVIACRHDGDSCCQVRFDTRALNGKPKLHKIARAR
jgi:predicted ArsR family transcriptional regulator